MTTDQRRTANGVMSGTMGAGGERAAGLARRGSTGACAACAWGWRTHLRKSSATCTAP